MDTSAADFTGDYYNDEVQNTLPIISKGDNIALKGFSGEPEFLAIREDVFGLRDMELVFERSDKGKVLGVTYNGPRVMRLKFEKQ